MSPFLLDSNVLIRFLRNDLHTRAMLPRWRRQGAYISVVTRTEIYAGMRPYEQGFTEDLLISLPSLLVDETISDQAGRWIYAYRRRGIQLSLPDTIIAATAWAHDLTLVTTNAKHFPMKEVSVLAVNS